MSVGNTHVTRSASPDSGDGEAVAVGEGVTIGEAIAVGEGVTLGEAVAAGLAALSCSFAPSFSPQAAKTPRHRTTVRARGQIRNSLPPTNRPGVPKSASSSSTGSRGLDGDAGVVEVADLPVHVQRVTLQQRRLAVGLEFYSDGPVTVLGQPEVIGVSR